MVEFNGHSIDCEPESFGPSGWSIGAVTILDRDGNPVRAQWDEAFCGRRYPTREAAFNAGVSAGKKWIQGLHPDEEWQEFGVNDLVSIQGLKGVWKIIGARTPEPRHQVQLGMDAASQQWVTTERLTIVQKHKVDVESGFYPPKSILG
jgi:hypothetical protein